MKATNSLFFGNLFGGGITYQLYTRQNPTTAKMIVYSNQQSLMYSSFNNAKPTRYDLTNLIFNLISHVKHLNLRILIHGYGQNKNSLFNRDITKSYLKRGDYNVITVDWSTVSFGFYQSSRYKVWTVGMALSKFITWLNPNYDTLHLVGYDLGAHIAGISGKNTVRGRINRIIGKFLNLFEIYLIILFFQA